MASTTLLSIPNEILDRIYAYLEWDPLETLSPFRPDIFNISLTSRRLRESIIPRLFQHVTLRLRWVDGAMREPALYRIRRDYPQLAKHVRSVYILTEFPQIADPDCVLPTFSVPVGLLDWVNPAALPDDPAYVVQQLHRQRVYQVAERTFDELRDSPGRNIGTEDLENRIASFKAHIFGNQPLDSAFLGPLESQRDLDRLGDNSHGRVAMPDDVDPAARTAYRIRYNEFRTISLQMDALVVAILCLPPTVTSLTFQAIPRGRLDTLKNAFALHVAAAALKIFGGRMHRLAIITSPTQSTSLATHLHHPRTLDLESFIITDEVLNGLEGLTTLVVSDRTTTSPSHRFLNSESQIQWSSLSSTLTRLELWDLRCGCTETAQFIKSFANLTSLAIVGVSLFDPNLARQSALSKALWLQFLIEVRREFPTLEFHLERLQWTKNPSPLPDGAIRWLLHEALTPGFISYERETRLIEDFESYLELWIAEDSERGQQARDARKDGSLVDLAMTNRWKTFANQR